MRSGGRDIPQRRPVLALLYCFNLEQDASDPSLLPRSYDVRVWVTRPHLALVEFPMSKKSSALMLEGEGVYYRWQCVGLPEVRFSLLSVADILRYSNYHCLHAFPRHFIRVGRGKENVISVQISFWGVGAGAGAGVSSGALRFEVGTPSN